MNALEPGSRIGRYLIQRRLGAGAMGEVYLAEDPQIGRELAIKTVRVEEGKPQEIEERTRRLLREARAAGKLLHPHIVTLFDAGEDQGVLYLAFEFVAGMDLADRLLGEPPLTLAEALAIVRQAAEALDFAHRQGVVHRDIKPSNLMITRDGRVKVADFGIAKLLDQTSDLTMTGSVVGSPHYLSPEQIRGEELDGRTDIFSLGVLLYEILCRKRPFEAETLTTLVYQILNKDPMPLGEVRPDLGARIDRLVRRMMHKDRDQRFATAAELATEVAACERELPPALLAGAAQPHVDPTAATTRLPDEVATAARAGSPTAAAATRPGGPSPVPGAVPATGSPRGRLGLVLGLGIALLAALLIAGVAARRWVAGRRALPPPTAAAILPAGRVAEPPATPRANAPQSASRAGASNDGAPAARDESPARAAEPAGDATPSGGASRASDAPAELPFQPGERPRPRHESPPVAKTTPESTAGRAASGASGGGVSSATPATAAPPPTPDAAAGGSAATAAGPAPATAAPAAPESAESAESPESAASSEHPRRDAIVERLPVDREMQTGMSLSFEILPKVAAERIVVRFDRIVIGRAAEWNASVRHGRAYSVPEPGPHILTFLVDGTEVYRIRIEAQPGTAAPTPIHAELPQFARRARGFGSR